MDVTTAMHNQDPLHLTDPFLDVFRGPVREKHSTHQAFEAGVFLHIDDASDLRLVFTSRETFSH